MLQIEKGQNNRNLLKKKCIIFVCVCFNTNKKTQQ